MRAKDFVNNTVAYHDTLCPVAWQGTDMLPEIRKKLLEIANIFVGYLEVPDFRVLDIVLTGSMANYNWTRFSDFDIHVVTEYDDLNADEIAEAFYQAKKKIWNDSHDITIKGHEAELYVEDKDEPPVAQGMFSLLNNKWLSQPDFEKPDVSTGAVYHKVKALTLDIRHALKAANDPNDITRIIDKVRKMRRAGLDTGGEFSVENLAFKVLRNMGLIDKLQKTFLKMQDSDLSLTEDSSTPDIQDLLKKFVPLIKKELGLKELPKINLRSDLTAQNNQPTFGRYDNNTQTVDLALNNRHPVDILRTLAHELVHYKQHLKGEMYPAAGETGSDIENEANAVAGVVMRHFNKLYPEGLTAKPVVEK